MTDFVQFCRKKIRDAQITKKLHLYQVPILLWSMILRFLYPRKGGVFHQKNCIICHSNSESFTIHITYYIL